MKKLALLLGALSLVSSVAYAKEVVPAVEEVVVVEEAAPVAAAPALRVTSFGQYVEVDNNSHVASGKHNANIGETVFFGNTVGLAYGDNWTFGLLGAKMWDMDTDDGIHGNDHRLQIDAWRNFENGSLGFRWRGQSTYDRYYLRGKYSYGMFSGWADLAYQSNNSSSNSDREDNWYSEGMPVCVTYGPVTAGYYYEWDKMINANKEGYEGTLSHQLRVMFPLYTGEKLSLSGEYRYQFAQDQDYEVKTEWQEKTGHAVILYAGYKLTENLALDGYYRYDFNEYEAKDGNQADQRDDYYGEFYAGWTYTF